LGAVGSFGVTRSGFLTTPQSLVPIMHRSTKFQHIRTVVETKFAIAGHFLPACKQTDDIGRATQSSDTYQRDTQYASGNPTVI